MQDHPSVVLFSCSETPNAKPPKRIFWGLRNLDLSPGCLSLLGSGWAPISLIWTFLVVKWSWGTRRGSKAKFMPLLQNNMDSVILILQLGEAVEIKIQVFLTSISMPSMSYQALLCPGDKWKPCWGLHLFIAQCWCTSFLLFPQSNVIGEAT